MSAVRWITENLGSGPMERVAGQPGIVTVDLRDLVDKSGNSADAIRVKIDAAVEKLRAGHKVVVCCDYGQSRSNAVAAGVLAVSEGIPFSEAVRRVVCATGEKEIKIEVLSAVRKALEVGGDCPRSEASDDGGVLITGGAGFVGSALIRHMGEGRGLFAPTHKDMDLLAGPIDTDLYVKDHGITSIVHLGSPRVYTSNSAMGETLHMLKNVLDVCRQNQLRLVYVSSWEVYSGYRATQLRASESLPLHPKGIYGETKYLCEMLIQRHAQEYGLDVAVVRSSPVYGSGSDRPKFLYNFLGKALRGDNIVTHSYINGFPSLDLLHISDLVSALACVIDRGYSGYLNVGTGRCTSTTEIAQMICNAVGSGSEISHLPVADYAANIAMDCGLAESRLGWRPRISLQEGLDQWVREKAPTEDNQTSRAGR